MKRRVTLSHSEWDLSTFSGIDSNYWDKDVPTKEVAPATEVDTSVSGDDGQGRVVGQTKKGEVEVVDPLSV